MADSKRLAFAGLVFCGGFTVPLAGIISNCSAQAVPPLTSAAVDPTIYRDGEVQRFSTTYGEWTIVCDEVTRLRQRFCSLRTAIVDSEGRSRAQLTVSTGQDGRPAALVRMLATLVRGGSLEISVSSAAPVVPTPLKTSGAGKSKPAPPAPSTQLRPVTCDADICAMIWTLKPEQIAALNDGSGLVLLATSAATSAAASLGVALMAPNNGAAVRLTVRAEGFAQAVSRSVQAFE
jgi:invasion protein IalB